MENLPILKSDTNFILHLQTNDFDFYCNLEESDENAIVKIFDKLGTLISDNYFAYSELYEVMTERRDEITFSSESMKYNMRQINLEAANY